MRVAHERALIWFGCSPLFFGLGDNAVVPVPEPLEPPAAAPGRPTGRRRVRPHPELVGAVGGLAVLALAIDLGALDGVTLDAPTLITTMVAAATLSFVVVVARRTRRWWTRTMPGLLGAVAAMELCIVWWLRASATITDPYPPTFLVWVGAAARRAGGGRGRLAPGRAAEARWSAWWPSRSPWPRPSC